MPQPTTLRTDRAPAAVGPYAQGVRLGDLVFCSGQLPIDPVTGEIAADVEAQTHQSLSNVAAVLEAGGASLATVVKTTVFLKDMNQFALMNAVYQQFFGTSVPARSTIEVARLPRDVLVEIEAIAGVSAPQE